MNQVAETAATKLMGPEPKSVRRERTPDIPEIRKEMKAIAATCHRTGVILERKAMIMNHKKMYRLCKEEKLGIR